ncbi:NADH-quinone oxidoreductase subunit M [Conexibacter sp. JD483]|uniref:complex I subunit 4 family protein n=1 Tax=unclassified Conexibacter TaxID=2627773 RepID=UPI002716151A|nr:MULTISPECIES: NADH-quinone oxidoreductase subunit M [unclassified Conexibacter]MDO8187418.1 NADH-quinone oxidoreductase subunit M [Conexibacter sp. CPCC 205706]MDO8201013.1 NADH-quinone oxidoreductase subunit M [Conexibacter sp. CPCC 205762]MDR9370308.1 NADH-quinone oxidoreductase subunit M [Conexibacter sp. JD483]
MTLSILIWLPLVVAVLGAILGAKVAPKLSLVGSLVTLGIAISFVVRFKSGEDGLQFVTDTSWISTLGISYKLGVDGLNVLLLLLAAFLFALVFVYANLREWERPGLFYFWLGVAQTAVLGAFVAQDLILFVAFFDLMLIPFYFLTGIWGNGTREERVRGTQKLVIYTLVGSLLMLVAAIATGVLTAEQHDTRLNFAISALQELPLSKGSQEWIFLCFAAAFLVKMPAFPLHGWLPDGYKAMPLPALGVFSGVLSKVAAYGFLRIVLPVFPDASVHFQELLLLIALGSILYGSVMAFSAQNVRLVVAFSSVAQMGFITLGIFALNEDGAQGALLQMVNHGLVTVPLFFIVGLLAARAGGSEEIKDLGGIAFRAPVLATLFLIVSLATLAMPGSANFAGEFLILLGVFNAKAAFAFFASIGVALAAVYMLRAFIKSMHNRVNPSVDSREISFSDLGVLLPSVVVILALALYPQFGLKKSEQTTKQTVAQVQAKTGQLTADKTSEEQR